MRYCITIRNAALLLYLGQSIAARAQATSDSPYSAYGFGDLLPAGQAAQALMAGNGIALTEPYAVLMGNPASYAALARPVFEAGAAFRSARSSSATAATTLKDANFTGFNIGVPFGRGKWGLALGLAPFSDVGYSISKPVPAQDGTITYNYTGSGGINRVFAGLGRTLLQHAADSLGNTGSRLLIGANFNFFFGSMEETREAVYPGSLGYSNVRAFSSLVLRAPGADASVLWQGDLTRKKTKDADNWRWSAGASVQVPTLLLARYNQLVTTYTTNSGIETIRDTVPTGQETQGTVEFPLGLGFGIGVSNAHWAFTAEAKSRDWSASKVDVPGYALASPLRSATTFGAAVRFQPSTEGPLYNRAVYRFGVRQAQAPQEVKGRSLATSAATIGLSLPLNAAQTNSWLNIGAEFGQRGTTDEGLIKERYAMLWLGLTFTPWRGERWFTAPKIQ
ncbi:MAG: hypothetical protein JST38_20900 [Bacteroidetes bacterium]|nr:hypothetical protein [Bacteroidota bacterium]